MGERSRPYATYVVLAIAALALVGFLRPHRPSEVIGAGRAVGEVSAAERAATFTFDPGIAPSDRAAILAAVAHARPQAQALVAEVDGLVDVRVGRPEAASAVGFTETVGRRFRVTLDLGPIFRRLGQRGVDRLVLHEIGHVIDFALVPESLDQALDAQIPIGYGCDEQVLGGCAHREERFAESFAKWATGDIGVDLYIGYKVPPPDDLSAWGAPLARLLTR